jgi:hypothetical protein
MTAERERESSDVDTHLSVGKIESLLKGVKNRKILRIQLIFVKTMRVFFMV